MSGTLPWKPRANPWLVAVIVTLGAFMEVLDTTIVNVSLPHIAGSLSISSDEATWTLTTYLVANGIDERPNAFVVGRILAFAGIVAVVYFGLQIGAEALAGDSLPRTVAARGPLELAFTAAIVLAFALLTFLQGQVPRAAATPRWQAVYAHVSNGLYVNTIANRLVLRYWPSAPRRSAEGSQ